ncbi:hypothetical protein [Longimicrobium sp.]|uniref:hypothetical protein n=1 Tax=Longimicrobium sp. TaxID=2029185 RepID=UPI002E35493C|nr:hypothetical protein [Longimicrobium sp.]HEX6038040.1 hypothetical protein [Longimicrobium sp.]
MFDLPLRAAEIPTEIKMSDGQLVTIVSTPLSDDEFYALNEKHLVKEADGTWRYHLSGMPTLFQDHLVRIEGLTIAGDPFDPERPEHVASVPPAWKQRQNLRLLEYSSPPTGEDRGNSKPRDDLSPADSIPSTDSEPGSAG